MAGVTQSYNRKHTPWARVVALRVLSVVTDIFFFQWILLPVCALQILLTLRIIGKFNACTSTNWRPLFSTLDFVSERVIDLKLEVSLVRPLILCLSEHFTPHTHHVSCPETKHAGISSTSTPKVLQGHLPEGVQLLTTWSSVSRCCRCSETTLGPALLRQKESWWMRYDIMVTHGSTLSCAAVLLMRNTQATLDRIPTDNPYHECTCDETRMCNI